MGEDNRVTVHDVARIAGLSAMSVSRVISGKRSVSAETERRVRAAIESTGFRLNRTASNLRQGRRLLTLGIIVDNLGDPYFAEIIRAAQEVAAKSSAVLVAASPTPDSSQTDIVRALAERGLDGLLVQPSTTDWIDEAQAGLPVVLLARTGGMVGMDAVVVDNVQGGRLAAEHLLQMGHRRVAVLDYGSDVPRDDSPIFADTRADRLRGFQSGMADAGIVADPALVLSVGSSVDAAASAARQIAALDDPPTAFFCLNRGMTVGVVHGLGAGLQGFGLVGIDDFEFATALTPKVTVVTQDPPSTGRIGAEVLLRRLADPSAPLMRVERPMNLIVRESGRGTRLP